MFLFGNAARKQVEIINPLFSYPGSKQEAINLIYPHLKDWPVIVSPFLGGGSLEINLANRGHKVICYDNFAALINFYNFVKTQNHDLYILIESKLSKIRKLNYVEYKIEFREMYNRLFEKSLANTIGEAADFFILQQSSFNCIIRSKQPSSNFKLRLSKNIVKRIDVYNNQNFIIGGCRDFYQVFTLRDDPLYLDPPYVDVGKNLYGTEGKEFNHELLANLLSKRKNWVLSYNDCDLIRSLYKDYEIIPLEWRYRLNNSKQSNEILIKG